MSPTNKRKWRKILYENQHVPDNYMDDSFLDELKKNIHTREYDYWTVVKKSGAVTQQMCSVIAFVVVYVYMREHTLSPEMLFVVSSLLTLIGYALHNVIEYKNMMMSSNRTRWDDLKTMLMFIGFSFGLSPVLVSLTETISTDTIYAMTTVMLLANLLFHDYGASTAAVVSWSLSLNAAFFASVCLASRLHTSWHAFAIVTFALELFALWPFLRSKLETRFPSSQIALTVLLGAASTVALVTVSTVAAILFTALYLFITFICPMWLIRLHPYKNNIYGPWDEAVIKR